MKPLNHCPSMEVLLDLAYGELDPFEVGPVQSHIADCAACALEWNALSHSLELAGELPGGPVSPSPEVELRLKALVAAQAPLWTRMARYFWMKVSSPVPAYQALLGGAALALVVQVIVASTVPPAPLAETPRAPEPRTTSIKIQPVQDLSQPFPREELERNVDALPADHYAQLY